jgi:hypothetical protein
MMRQPKRLGFCHLEGKTEAGAQLISNEYDYFMERGQLSGQSGQLSGRGHGAAIAAMRGMLPPPGLIEIRHLESQGRRFPVHLSRNEHGSVAGRVIFSDDDAPILDGPDVESVLKVIEDHLQWFLLAREPAARRSA